jgi:hypothetical protein
MAAGPFPGDWEMSVMVHSMGCENLRTFVADFCGLVAHGGGSEEQLM